MFQESLFIRKFDSTLIYIFFSFDYTIIVSLILRLFTTSFMIQKWQVYKEKFPEETLCVQENKGNFPYRDEIFR